MTVPADHTSDSAPRTNANFDLLGTIRAEVMVFQPMTIREIHGGGVVAETSFSLQVNSLHELRLALGDRSVVVRGRVVSSSISEVDQQLVMYRSALEFIEPPEHALGVILEFVKAIQGH